MLNIDDRFLTESTQDQYWLMCHIARFMNEDSTCFPSNAKLCDITGWKISKLNEVKKSCIDAGLLKAETRFSANGQTSNTYTVLTDRISVMVNLKGRKAHTTPTTLAAPPYHAGDTPPTTLAVSPPTTLAAPEVLTNIEVLTNEPIDSAPENSTPLNAEKKDTPPIPAAPPIIRYSDIPRFVTPVELEDKLSAFFSQNIDEWKITVETGQMEYSKRGLIFDECSAVKGYCEWATENATMRNKDYQAHNARLRRWVRDQPGFARGSFSTKPKQQINPGSSADKFKEKQAF